MAAAFGAMALPGLLVAAEGDITAPEVEVVGTYETGVGTSDAASEGTVTARRIETRPALRPGEVLEYIPGLIVTQHSGDGKANQYFLRGFNLDHGTDFSITAAGMPVNMPTHAHGQGYADLNFLIPELVSGIDYRKGPYYAEVGDFSSAGAADIHYATSLPHSIGSVTLGEHDYKRALLAGSPNVGGGTLLYGIELMGQDGPWDNPENFRKLNTVLRYSRGDKADGIAITGMAYKANWDSTDQIPQRAVASGLLDRFGAVDPSDGGETSRYSLSYEQHHDFAGGRAMVDVFAIRSSLTLWSNFTFFLDDPVNGDQFEQHENRIVLGVHPRAEFYGKLAGMDSIFKIGLQARRDDIDPVALYHTVERQIIGTTRSDTVVESSVGLYADETLQVADKFRMILGVRGDRYDFDVNSDIPQNSGRVSDSIVSPKLSFIFGPWSKTEYFINYGTGFHSNDARGTTITVDPSNPSVPAEKVTPLVRSFGSEVGLRSELVPHLQTSLSLWQLRLESELLFTGDAGTTEPSRPTKRTGIEWSNHYRANSWLLLDLDLSVSRARFADQDPAGDEVPGSIEQVASFGVTVDSFGPWYGMLQYRYFGPRPLIEDNSVRSQSTQVTNLRVGYKIDPKWRVHLDVFNLFDREDHDIDYFYASQLRGEPAPVDDIHFHPIEPRTLRFTLTGYF
ncbi:MAG TPA: TonB-dependent receptor [Burkholderiales bacterium]|nr:TonB-dependent receptor [Burkholderiales bacterium]